MLLMSSRIPAESISTINVQPQEPQYAVQQLRRRLRTLDIEKANSLSRQSKAGVLIPEVSRDLQNALKAVETFLESLRTRDEKMVLANFLVYVRGKTPEEVDAVMKSVQDRVAAAGCSARPFRFDHENGLNSVVPLGRSDCFVSRTFTTSSIAAFVPFNVVEIVQDNGFSYGRNGRSNNVLTLNRKNYTNAHGFYFGTSGSGKSMGAKAEIWECYWRTSDKILIIDPDGEFIPLVEMMGGEVVDLSNSSTSHFNPFDINEYYGGDEDPNPVPLKSDFIISLIEITLNYHNGIDPITKSVIDKCVREIYQPYLSKPKPQNVPTFEDFYEALLRQESQEAQDLARALEIYVHGSLNLFNGRTNVDTENRVLCFSTRNLGKQLRVMGMSIIQDFCWNLISRNQAEKKTTWLWNDEIHHSLRNPTTAEWLMNSWKRGRKYGLIATGMTQEVRDVCRTEESKALIANSEFIMIYRENTTFLVSLLRRRKNNETKKQREYKAAVHRQAAKKAARQAAQKAAQQQAQQVFIKEAGSAAAKKAALSSPPVLILLAAAGLLALVVLLVTLTTALTSLFGGVGASLDDTALETYVTSLDTSFRNEIENKMGKDDERQGSYPNTNAYALALLATGDWVVDSLTAEIKAEMSRIYDLLNTYKTKDGEIRVDGEDGGMGYIKHIKIYVITRKAPEDILDELGYSGEERKRMEQRLEELYTLQEIFPSDGIAGGGGEIIDPDADWIGTGIFQWPLPENGTITSYFGNRVNPVTGKPDFHTGTDIAMPEGTPILAAADGTVEIANGTDSWGDSYGYYVKLDHGSGFETLYAHCSSICVTAGQEVSQGEVIGYVGTTGNSTGNHLHFEVRKNGQRVDALDYFTSSKE